MADKKISKKEAKAPDAFLTMSEKIAKYIEQNFKVVSAVAISLFLLGGGWATLKTWNNLQEARITSELYGFESAIQSLQEKALKSEDTPDGKAPPKVNFGEFYHPTVAQWIDAINRNSDFLAAQVSAMRLVGFLVSEQQIDLAAEALESLKKTHNGVIQTLLLMQKAGLATEKNNWDQARDLYQAVLDQKEGQFVHPVATVRLGLVHMELGDAERASQLLERASTEYSDSPVGIEAKGLLRLLRLKKNLGSSSQEDPKG